MKKKIITGSILAVIVIVAVIIFGTVFNERATEKTEAMKGASLPVISFKEGEYTINTLFGYTGKYGYDICKGYGFTDFCRNDSTGGYTRL